MCVFFVKFSLCITTVPDNVTNNIVTLVYFSTLTTYDDVTDVDYTVFYKAGQFRKTPSLKKTPLL